MQEPRGTALAWATAATVVALLLVFYPEVAFKAALRGLEVWWFVVFPALLPFFIAGQVLMALGVVHFLGVLLERLMRPLFNVPGVGGFVVAMGLASGYPIGAVLTSRLRREGQINTAEAERLIGFCNTADPLFMAGAVAVGMFGRPALGGALVGAHYLAALGTGLILRFHRRGERSPDPAPGAGGLLSRATDALVAARQRDGRPLGQLMGDAVRDSVQTLLLVGGFIILFAVIIDILTHLGVVAWISAGLAVLLHPLGVGRAAAASLVSGFFEITIGTKAASAAPAPLLQRLVLCNAIIAWSGLSVFAQVAAVSQGTGISLRPYVLARLIQAVLAGALTFWFWNPAWAHSTVPALAPLAGAGAWAAHISFTGMLDRSLALLALLLVGTVAMVALPAWAAGARVSAWRVPPGRAR